MPKARRALPLYAFATDRAIQNATPKRIDEIAAQVEIDDATGCWLWTGYTTPKGYGVVSINSTKVRVHRAAYWWHVAPIPHRFEIDHTCRVNNCCNPDHLEAVPHAENVARGEAGNHMAAKTHCPKGHAYSGDNLYVSKIGNRKCKTCNRERMGRTRSTKTKSGST